jgi:bisanhydrobacterioruberin hydratase
MAHIKREGLFALAKRRADELGYGRIVTALIIILFAVGTAGHLYRPTLPLMLSMTPWFLLGCGIAVILPSLGSGGLRFGLWAFVIYALTFFLEALGVATGLVFGAYRYGPTLGLAAFEVPLVIAFNWVLVVYGAIRVAERRVRSDFLASVIAGVIATGFDWIMEPVAILFNYWTWSEGFIPLQNYLAWFAIAFVSSFAYRKLVRRAAAGGGPSAASGSLAGVYVLIQALFFAALRMGWTLGI